jgi:NAD(P)-dependent dehydrogenase (short-subunit alcohol dehydrogenase family)
MAPANSLGITVIDFGLKDRIVCVTGGASGIGRACALALAKDGASVAILDMAQEAVDQVVSEIRSSGAEAAGFAGDIRDAAILETALDHFEGALGPVDALIGSAGTSRVGAAEDIPERDFDLVMSVNVKGLFLCCQAVGKRLIRRGAPGAMVLIGSLDGLGGHAGRTHYVVSKFAVSGLTKNLALEWGRCGIRVNCVAPTFVDTPAVRHFTPSDYLDKVVCDRTPMGRLATVDDVAQASLVLLSSASSFISGVVLPVDGGLTTGYVTRDNGADQGWVVPARQ